MKVLIFCIVLGTSLNVNIAEELPSGCPPDEDPRYPTHLPHSTDCDKFWKCYNGEPYLNYCESGLQWSIENSWCDYPENAKCVRPIPEDGEDSGEGENGGQPDLPTGCPRDEDPRYPTHLPHATDCDKFWKCWSGVPHLNECPEGQHWSIENSWCDYIQNAKCVRPIPEDGGNGDSDESNGEDSGESGGETDLPTGCPPDEDPRYPTHLPHANDCNKFWKCWSGVPYLNECPEGQHWSIENSWCDYIENAKCVRPVPEDGGENSVSGEDSSEEGGETDLPTGCPSDEDPRYPTHLPHATDCDKFWKCWDGVPYLNECPQGQHWSIENTWCDYIENVKCVRPIPEDGGGNGGGNSGSEESGENGGEIEPPTDCPSIGDPSGPDHFPHATDCTKFWQCVDGNAYLNECPSGLHWNIERQYCDYAANANCVRPLQNLDNQNSKASVAVANGYSCPADEGIDNPVHLPHASDCTKFYKCFNGAPVLHECPGELEWNIEANYCDYAAEANCIRPLQDKIEIVEENLGVVNGYSCPAEDDIENPAHLPHASDCTKFYKCYNGEPVLQECPAGLEWNIEGNYCDYASEANCVRPLQQTVVENVEETSSLPTGCPSDEDPLHPTHLPHVTDCDKFWKCWDGVPYLHECPQGQHWSIEHTWCDYIENAKCVRPIPEDGGENGSGGEESGEEEGEDSGENGGEIDLPTECPADEDPRYPTHLPHATDCDKFWKCWDGVPYLHECPQGQHWSIENSWCDYIENAKCVRPIPDESGEDGGENGGSEESGENGGEIEPPSNCPEINDPSGSAHIPHATDCTKFWQCVYGNAYLHECPSGLHWSIERQYCEYPAIANCVRPL